MSDALYQALIIEHDRSPRNAGPLPGATHTARLDNPLCGDVVAIHAIVDGTEDDSRVIAVTAEARGCALCRAAASMMTTHVTARRVDEIAMLVARVESFVAGSNGDEEALGELVVFRGVQAVRSRRTCVTLPFRAIAHALGAPV